MKSLLEKYYDIITDNGLYSNKGNFIFHMNYVFKGVNFLNKRVLDIGGGNGIFSYYASCMGAKEVVCLEPCAAGSTNSAIEEFENLGKLLGCDNISIKPKTFQEYFPHCEGFEIILLNNSINHLDETACINLLNDQSAKEIYEDLAFNISSIVNPGAEVIICDCSNYNFWAMLNVKNPFAPSIEWHKHQSPKVWSDIFVDAGFIQPKVRWSSFNKLRYFGKVLTGNKLAAYFLNSHFCLSMKKP